MRDMHYTAAAGVLEDYVRSTQNIRHTAAAGVTMRHKAHVSTAMQ